jgi:hypothetical protein
VTRAVTGERDQLVVSPFVLAELDYLVGTRIGVNAETDSLACGSSAPHGSTGSVNQVSTLPICAPLSGLVIRCCGTVRTRLTDAELVSVLLSSGRGGTNAAGGVVTRWVCRRPRGVPVRLQVACTGCLRSSLGAVLGVV